MSRDFLLDGQTQQVCQQPVCQQPVCQQPVCQQPPNQQPLKYLDVPFDEKDYVKQLGARWCQEKKQWYCTQVQYLADSRFKQWDSELEEEIFLINEDRTDNQLFIDMIPSTQWHENVRSSVSKKDWDKLRRFVYKRANNFCECCGVSGQLDAHERWQFIEETQTQKLIRLIGLCKNCHMSTHYGLAVLMGNSDIALNHLKEVRGFDDQQVQKHIQEQKQLFDERSRHAWKLDLQMLGISVTILNEQQRKEKRIAQERQMQQDEYVQQCLENFVNKLLHLI